jgi:diguanylate cyclase (GGDEF)-like protein
MATTDRDEPRAHQLRTLYRQEELRGERTVNTIGLVLTTCLLPVLAVNLVFVGFSPNYLSNLLGFGIFATYHGALWLMLRRGHHHPALKYLTMAVTVSAVSLVVAGYAPSSGWVHALRSCTLCCYFLAFVLSGLYLSPRAAVFTGGLAALQYAGLFLWAVLGAGTPVAGMETFAEPALSWDILAVFVPVFLMASGTVAAMTRRSRFALVRAVFSEASRSELELIRERLESIAWHDVLTGLVNRRRFEETFERELVRARRYRSGLCLLMLDIDHFKRLNDQHGHSAGDRVLVRLAREVSGIIRETDCFGRWGGEEFTILCPGIDVAGARAMAEKIRRHIATLPVEGGEPSLSVSIGVTDCCLEDSLESIIERADSALYAAKEAGRNRVGVRPISPPLLGEAVH